MFAALTTQLVDTQTDKERDPLTARYVYTCHAKSV